MARLTELEKRLSGDEPKFDGIAPQYKISQAYTWYNTYCDTSQLKKYFLEYAKKKYGKKVLAVLTLAKDYDFSSVGPLVRMISRGLKVDSHSNLFIDNKVKHLSEKYKTKKAEKVQKKVEPAMTVQDYIRDKVRDTIGDLEEEIDKGIANDYRFTFKVSGYIQTRDLKKPILTEVIKYYTKLQDEISAVLGGKDDQLKEAYKGLGKRELNRYFEFVTSILRESENRITLLSSSTKVRKKKIKTPEQLVKGMKCHPKSPVELTKIIGANVLVVYIENIRRLCVYHADSNHGLSVKGSGIINFDKTKSVGFTLRKPDQVLSKLQGINLRGLNNLVKENTSKKGPVNGRISKNILLLATIK